MPATRAAAIEAALTLRSPEAFDIREVLEARLLAGQDDATITARCALELGVVAAYSALFYDVRPLLPHSDALLFRAIGERIYDPDGGGAPALLRLSAYQGGPVVVDALLGRRGDPDAAGEEGPDPASVRAFELFVKSRAVTVEEIGLGGVLRLLAHVERMDALATPEPVVAPRSVPQPDLAAMEAVVMPPAARDAGPRLGVAG